MGANVTVHMLCDPALQGSSDLIKRQLFLSGPGVNEREVSQ
jgi:hypothetical protein